MDSLKGFAAAAWIAIAAVVLIGGGAYVYTNPEVFSSMKADTEMGDENGTGASLDANFEGSLTAEELLSRGQNVTCTYAFSGGDSETTGTVFVADGKLRSDSRTVAGGDTYLSHVIIRDGKANMWTDGMTMGFTSSISGAVSSGSSDQAPDLNSKLDYTCVPWTADESKFELPASVNFQAIVVPSAS